MLNLCHRQQRKVYVPAFERNVIPVNLHSFSYVTYERCTETKECSFARGLL